VKRLVCAALSAVAIVTGATPAWASLADRARDDHACAHEQVSPSCSNRPEPPGFTQNHNEMLVRDA
jgi:hypothetical protein